MATLTALNSREVKKLLQKLDDQYNFKEKLDYAFFINTKNKIYLISKEISNIELEKVRFDTAGMYFGQLVHDDVRLSIEGSQLIGKDSKKNIIELNKEQLIEWLKGEDIELQANTDNNKFVLIKHNNDFYGCGKYSNNKLHNFIPKARRMKVVNY